MSKTSLDTAIEQSQQCLAATPLIVLGSGASAPHGLPTMANLARHLTCLPPQALGEMAHDDGWQAVCSVIGQGVDLETALRETDLSETTASLIVRHAWETVAKADSAFFDNAVSTGHPMPLSHLYRHLFDSTNRTLSVITTNYDRLAEYAADFAGYCHYKGFGYGYCGRPSGMATPRIRKNDAMVRTVDIWKVHGCVDWFKDKDQTPVCISAARTIPQGHTPAIVTPGIGKFEETHQEPFRSVITRADQALDAARAFLCIGFGFGDTHICPKLVRRWREGDAMLVILTEVLTDATRALLESPGDGKFLAFEKHQTGTIMRSEETPQGALLDDLHLWKLPEFLTHAT